MSNEVVYAVWVDFYAFLRRYPDICKSGTAALARDMDHWFESSENKWAKTMVSKGFLLTLADFTYEDSRETINKMLQAFEDNYKDATMEYYQLLGWAQFMSFLIERAEVYYNIQIKDMESIYGKDLCKFYKCFDFQKCYDNMRKLYNKIWSKTRHLHTIEHAEINHNNDRTKNSVREFNEMLTDVSWIQERLRKTKLTYEINMYGYRDIK